MSQSSCAYVSDIIPPPYDRIFTESFKVFNEMQSSILEQVLHTDDNMFDNLTKNICH